MDANQSKIKIPAILQGEWPEWVCNVARELIETLYPVPQFAIGTKISPSALGAFIGQRLAYFHCIAGANPSDVGSFPETTNEAETREIKVLISFVEGAIRHAAASVSLAMLQADEKACDFLTGFAKGFATKPDDLKASNFVRSTTPIYWLLLRSWRSVANFKNLDEFHAALCRFLGKNTVGSKVRIAKLCQRIGLRFRGRGRPRKKRK